jgi:putative ABC transport system permease protein
LIVAVTLAVAALTAVGFFADRLKGGLARDARQLLGWRRVVVSDTPTPRAFVERAAQHGLQSVTRLVFPSMGARRKTGAAPAGWWALKVVPAGYPLRAACR